MRAAAPALAALAAVACLSLAGCAGAAGARAGSPPAPRVEPRCAEAWARVSAALRGGLDEYLAGMRRFAAARDGASTDAAEARARARAVEWEARRRPEVERACGTWAPETLACTLQAASARSLADCGPEPEALVTSYTDEVVAAFAASPLR